MKPEKAYRRQAIVALDFIQEKKTARGAGGYGSTGVDFLPVLKGGDSLNHAVSWFKGGSH